MTDRQKLALRHPGMPLGRDPGFHRQTPGPRTKSFRGDGFSHAKFGFIVLVFCFSLASAEPKSPLNWKIEFAALTPGMSRLDVEKEIERVRKVKSSYDLWAMDTSSIVPYQLDPETILLVTYKPGSPAAHVVGGNGRSPVDGKLVSFDVLLLK